MLPKSVAKRSFANAERAGDGFGRGGTGSDGNADIVVFGGALKKPCSGPSEEGRQEAVFLELIDAGSVGGKRGSSSSVSSLARSKVSTT